MSPNIMEKETMDASSTPDAQTRQFERILIVDDEEDMRNMLSMFLMSKGYRVDKAENATKAQQFLMKTIPDMILMDVMLPDMSGIGLCRWVRSQPLIKHVPVIQISALNDDNFIKESKNLGVIDYMVKPFKLEELFCKIEAVLSRADRARIAE